MSCKSTEMNEVPQEQRTMEPGATRKPSHDEDMMITDGINIETDATVSSSSTVPISADTTISPISINTPAQIFPNDPLQKRENLDIKA